jgi:hypothetical protein
VLKWTSIYQKYSSRYKYWILYWFQLRYSFYSLTWSSATNDIIAWISPSRYIHVVCFHWCRESMKMSIVHQDENNLQLSNYEYRERSWLRNVFKLTKRKAYRLMSDIHTIYTYAMISHTSDRKNSEMIDTLVCRYWSFKSYHMKWYVKWGVNEKNNRAK